MAGLRCGHCGRLEAADDAIWRCPCGGPLTLDRNDLFDAAKLAARPFDIWRYREAYGLAPDVPPVTLGEGFTPIVEKTILGLTASFKLESLMPTGSFKDRGASVLVSHHAARGVTRAVEDSSGNAGLALAAYGSRGGIRMDIVVPDDAPGAKVSAIALCGGAVVKVPGGRAVAAQEALRRAAAGVPFASHCYDPYFLEGMKSFAFELWEQIGARLPRRIFIPVGNGTLLLGAFRGFAALRERGLIENVPALVAVQAASCAPLCEMRHTPDDGREGLAPATASTATAPTAPAITMADGIRVARPVRARAIREAVARTSGAFVAVEEEAISEARDALGLAGIDAEPTAAVSFAGALALARQSGPESAANAPPPLVVVTGSGLKASAAVA